MKDAIVIYLKLIACYIVGIAIFTLIGVSMNNDYRLLYSEHSFYFFLPFLVIPVIYKPLKLMDYKINLSFITSKRLNFLFVMILIFVIPVNLYVSLNFVLGSQDGIFCFYTFKTLSSLSLLDWIIAFISVIIIPFYEELIFRFYIQDKIKQSYGRLWAIIITSFMVTLLHMPYNIWIVVFLGFLFLGFLYDITGRLIYSIVCHALWNLINVFIDGHIVLDVHNFQKFLIVVSNIIFIGIIIFLIKRMYLITKDL